MTRPLPPLLLNTRLKPGHRTNGKQHWLCLGATDKMAYNPQSLPPALFHGDIRPHLRGNRVVFIINLLSNGR